MAKPHFCGLFTNQHSSAYIGKTRSWLEKGEYGLGDGADMKIHRLACFYREEEYFATLGESWEGCYIHPKSSEGALWPGESYEFGGAGGIDLCPGV